MILKKLYFIFFCNLALILDRGDKFCKSVTVDINVSSLSYPYVAGVDGYFVIEAGGSLGLTTKEFYWVGGLAFLVNRDFGCFAVVFINTFNGLITELYFD